MTNSQISELIQQFANGTISEQDYQLLISHFKLSGNDKEIYEAMDRIWKDLDTSDINYTAQDTEQFYNKLITNRSFSHKPVLRHFKRWYAYTAAAMVLVAVSAGLYFFIDVPRTSDTTARYKNDVAPGTTAATLTLADGKVIDLNGAANGNIANQQGVSIIKTKDGQLVYDFQNTTSGTSNDTLFNTITTPRGGQYQVALPDGSHVWLNTASSLKFPVRFSPHERKVLLTGEGYFEVSKKPLKPFRIITADEQIEVLGTHFNVHAYGDEPVQQTTLLEGTVKVTASGQTMMLKPGQQSVLKGNNLNLRTADTEEAVAWKNGLFMYNEQSLELIMKQVGRWYNVDVVFEDEGIKRQVFSGTLSRFKNISQLLEVLETTGSVHFKIEGRKITVMK